MIFDVLTLILDVFTLILDVRELIFVKIYRIISILIIWVKKDIFGPPKIYAKKEQICVKKTIMRILLVTYYVVTISSKNH